MKASPIHSSTLFLAFSPQLYGQLILSVQKLFRLLSSLTHSPPNLISPLLAFQDPFISPGPTFGLSFFYILQNSDFQQTYKMVKLSQSNVTTFLSTPHSMTLYCPWPHVAT